MNQEFGGTEVYAEIGKLEDRKNNGLPLTLNQFINRYTDEDLYTIWDITSLPMHVALNQLTLPPPLRCGGYQHALTKAQLWFSSGGTRSVFHVDGIENMHCTLDGSKTFYLVEPSFQDLIEQRGSQDDGKADVGAGNAGNDTNSFGWDFSGDCSVANMSALDLSKYPGFASLPYSKVELLKGDCLYIPASWYHVVETPRAVRSLTINVWFRALGSETTGWLSRSLLFGKVNDDPNDPSCNHSAASNAASSSVPVASGTGNKGDDRSSKTMADAVWFDEQHMHAGPDGATLAGPGAHGFNVVLAKSKELAAAGKPFRFEDFAPIVLGGAKYAGGEEGLHDLFQALDRNADGVLQQPELAFGNGYGDERTEGKGWDGDGAGGTEHYTDEEIGRFEWWNEAVVHLARLATLSEIDGAVK
eukprot:gene2877-11076_t